MTSNTERAGPAQDRPAANAPRPPASRNGSSTRMVSTATARTANTSAAIEEMRRLVADLDYWHKREESAFREAYAAGFAAGRDVGYAQAENDMERAWASVTARVRAVARLPKQDELTLRRYGYRDREELLKLRGRDRYPLTDRVCAHCDQSCPYCGGRGVIPGGAA